MRLEATKERPLEPVNTRSPNDVSQAEPTSSRASPCRCLLLAEDVQQGRGDGEARMAKSLGRIYALWVCASRAHHFPILPGAAAWRYALPTTWW